MQKMMFNDEYRLTKAVLDRRKTKTRREPYYGVVCRPNVGYITEGKDAGRLALCDGEMIVHKSRFKLGEIVAVAQAYQNIPADCLPHGVQSIEAYAEQKGWSNKMYVKSDFMPNQIRITDIKAERLQDISDEDCMKEGICRRNDVLDSNLNRCVRYSFENWFEKGIYRDAATPKEAFAVLIDKVSGKGTWEANPWVFAYSFELVK